MNREILFLVVCAATCFGRTSEAASIKAYSSNPARFEASIQRFEVSTKGCHCMYRQFKYTGLAPNNS